MMEQGLQKDHKSIFSKLNGIGNSTARTSSEQLKLYDCYTDLIRQAVTHKDKYIVDKHLGEAQRWYDRNLEGTQFRN